MWHPVGPLPARVYWRRRLVVLVGFLAVVGGATWLTLWLLAARADDSTPPAASTAVRVPALEQVVPTPATIVMPAPPVLPPATTTAEQAPAPPAPAPGDPCSDDMIGLEVRTPGAAAVGDKPTFELVVTNVSAVPCVRALDAGLQELQLVDAAGARRWGSNDCFPEASSDLRTLAPGEAAVFPVVWGGLTSDPGCATPRQTPAPGAYTVVGRLDTKMSPPAPLTLG